MLDTEIGTFADYFYSFVDDENKINTSNNYK